MVGVFDEREGNFDLFGKVFDVIDAVLWVADHADPLNSVRGKSLAKFFKPSRIKFGDGAIATKERVDAELGGIVPENVAAVDIAESYRFRCPG